MENNRFGKLFKLSNCETYFYDTGTGKVISCNEIESELIRKILNDEISIDEVCSKNFEFKDFIEKENLFKCPENINFIIPDKAELELLLKSSCEQIIIELTEECNLRCGYCIYNENHPEYRGFGTKKMNFEVAKKSLDLVLKDFKKDTFNLTFYGGEPLVNFELMKKCIDYVKNNYKHIKVFVSFTTNLTLINKEMIDYFNSLDRVGILCSIDGTKNMHDRFRRYKNGKGSFDDAIRGLKLLMKYFYVKNSESRNISINTVICPPYSYQKFDEIENFFRNELNLPEDVDYRLSYVELGDMVYDFNEEKIINEIIDSRFPAEDWAHKKIKKENKNDYMEQISDYLLRIAKRLKNDSGIMVDTYLHGNCIPGQRRLYVTVDGNFRVCERIGSSPFIGNYKYGFNKDNIYKYYYENYIEFFSKRCSNCWAQHLCSICYQNVMLEDGSISSDIERICRHSKRVIEDSLVKYYSLLNEDRNIIEKMVLRSEQ